MKCNTNERRVCARVEGRPSARSRGPARRVGVSRYTRRWGPRSDPSLSISFLSAGHSWCARSRSSRDRTGGGEQRKRKGWRKRERTSERKRREERRGNGGSRGIPFVRNLRFAAREAITYARIISALPIRHPLLYSLYPRGC